MREPLTDRELRIQLIPGYGLARSVYRHFHEQSSFIGDLADNCEVGGFSLYVFYHQLILGASMAGVYLGIESAFS